MSFSQSCACNVVPLMARLVLGGVFIMAGYGKVFSTETFTGDDAKTLRELRGLPEPVTGGTGGSGGNGGAGGAGGGDEAGDQSNAAGWTLRRASVRFEYVQQDPPDDPETPEQPAGGGSPPSPAGGGTGENVGDQDDAGTAEEPASLPDEPTVGDAPMPEGGGPIGEFIPAHEDKGLFRIALMLKQHGLAAGYESLLAYVAAYTELIGGALILVGLFSRLWGLALAFTMGVAFYMTSWQGLTADAGVSAFLSSPMNASTMFIQLSLFVLAFGVFLTGAGAASIDRMLFKGEGEGNPADVDMT
jgi:uncharacterized membrane protein YphA (DoxX/SURF4 family)